MGVECKKILSGTRDIWRRDLNGEQRQINLNCFSRDCSFDSLHGENFMVTASEQKKSCC